MKKKNTVPGKHCNATAKEFSPRKQDFNLADQPGGLAIKSYLKRNCSSLCTLKTQLLFWIMNSKCLPIFLIEKKGGKRILLYNLCICHLKTCYGHSPFFFFFQKMSGSSD